MHCTAAACCLSFSFLPCCCFCRRRRCCCCLCFCCYCCSRALAVLLLQACVGHSHERARAFNKVKLHSIVHSPFRARSLSLVQFHLRRLGGAQFREDSHLAQKVAPIVAHTHNTGTQIRIALTSLSRLSKALSVSSSSSSDQLVLC